MKEIILSQGKVALVDDEDFEYLNQFKWSLAGGYAVRNITLPDGRKTGQRMHSLLIDVPEGMQPDHKDLNRINNQRSNLRVCTRSQNMMNRNKWGKLSKYKGVTAQKYNGRCISYVSQIKVNGKMIVKGFPFTPEGEIAAAKHYNEIASKHFGEFAKLNDI